jgi:hypothetical protein
MDVITDAMDRLTVKLSDNDRVSAFLRAHIHVYQRLNNDVWQWISMKESIGDVQRWNAYSSITGVTWIHETDAWMYGDVAQNDFMGYLENRTGDDIDCVCDCADCEWCSGERREKEQERDRLHLADFIHRVLMVYGQHYQKDCQFCYI